MGDKAIAIGIGSSLPVTLYRLGGSARGKIVPDTWSHPAFGPASGCRGLRPCMILHCLTGETVLQRSQIVNAVAFTVSGLSNASCGPFTFVAGGNLYSITLDYTGFTAMNGTYVSTTYEHPYNCQVRVADVTHTFTQTIKYNRQINGGAIASSTCNVQTTVTIRPYISGGLSVGAEFELYGINPDVPSSSGFEFRFFQFAMRTLLPCSNPGVGVPEPNLYLANRYDGRGGGAFTCGFKGASPIITDYHNNSTCAPLKDLAISRAWS